MAKNVRFIRTTKEKWLARDTYDPLALYFCEDTQEMCKGDQVLTDGIRVVPTKADLPPCPCAADGVIYYIAETKSGYMMSPDRTEWLQTIYAPVTDAYNIPESEMYTTVTTVGAVRDIENAIYEYIDKEIGLTPVDGTIFIGDTENGDKAIGINIATIPGNMLTAVDGGLFVPSTQVKFDDNSHGLVMVDGTLTLKLATKDSDGAMSKEDKALLDAIPDVYATSEEVETLKGTISDLEDSFIWGEM